MIAEITLAPEIKEIASILAERSFARYKNVAGHYRNTPNSHLVGKLGECAAFFWLSEQGCNTTPLFLDSKRDREADMIVDSHRVEIKTWSEQHWENLGRAVAVTQYPSIQKKADRILFVSVEGVDSSEPVARLRGWVEVEAFAGMEPKMTGVAGRQIHNLQIEPDQLKGEKEWKENRYSKPLFV